MGAGGSYKDLRSSSQWHEWVLNHKSQGSFCWKKWKSEFKDKFSRATWRTRLLTTKSAVTLQLGWTRLTILDCLVVSRLGCISTTFFPGFVAPTAVWYPNDNCGSYGEGDQQISAKGAWLAKELRQCCFVQFNQHPSAPPSVASQ